MICCLYIKAVWALGFLIQRPHSNITFADLSAKLIVDVGDVHLPMAINGLAFWK